MWWVVTISHLVAIAALVTLLVLVILWNRRMGRVIASLDRFDTYATDETKRLQSPVDAAPKIHAVR